MPPRLKAKILAILAVLLNRNCVYQRAGEVVEEALPLAEAVGDKETLAHLWQELSFKTTDYEMATDYLEKSLDLRREMQNPWSVALTLQLLGDRARIYGDLDRAESLYSESIAILRQINFTTRIAYPRGNQGRIAFERGDYAQARAIFEESIALCRKANAIAGIADWSFQLALVSLVQGDYEQAQAAIHETLTLCSQLGNLSEITDCLVLSAGLALALGQFERAAKLLGASEIALEQYHNILEPSTRTRYDTYAHETRAQLSESAFESHFHAGRILSIEHAINYAMEIL
jgi:tetratricopeptide (TPR) repeat protein